MTGVLDWDRSEMDSVPFLDLLDLWTKHDEDAEDSRWADNIVHLHESLSAGSPDTALLRDYAQQIGVPGELISKFVVVYWLKECVKRVCRNFNPAAAMIAVRKPLSYFQEFIGPTGKLASVPAPPVGNPAPIGRTLEGLMGALSTQGSGCEK